MLILPLRRPRAVGSRTRSMLELEADGQGDPDRDGPCSTAGGVEAPLLDRGHGRAVELFVTGGLLHGDLAHGTALGDLEPEQARALAAGPPGRIGICRLHLVAALGHGEAR